MFNLSNYTLITADTQLQNMQLSVCKTYELNVQMPLYVAIVLLLFRWFVIYRFLDIREYPKAFRLTEIVLDVGAMICIVISIVWMSVI